MNELLLRLCASLARRQQAVVIDALPALCRGLSTASCSAPSTSSIGLGHRAGGLLSSSRPGRSSLYCNGPHAAQAWRYAQASAQRAEDYYSLLGLQHDASEQEIKKAYYKLAKQYHPDTNQGNEEAARKFQELQRAYETLRDPEKRALYDRVGPEGMERMEQEGGFPGGAGGYASGMDAAEMLRNMMGGGGMGHPFFEQFFRSTMVYQVPINLHLSFMEAVKGTKRPISVAVPGFSASDLVVEIPPGAYTGAQIPVDVPQQKGARQQVQVVLVLSVDAHPTFQRDGADIVVQHTIPLTRALLGCKRQVDTIDGPVEVQVPAGSQNGDKLVIRGRGTYQLGLRQRGNQIVILQVQAPRALSERQRELLQEFEAEERKKGQAVY